MVDCLVCFYVVFFFFSSRRRHTRYWRDWSSDVCSSDLYLEAVALRSGHRLEVVRPHLEAAFERLADSIVGSGALDGRALVAFGASLERSEERRVGKECRSRWSPYH